MALRPVIEFRSGFPDDTVEENDDILRWPGLNIAEAVRAELEQL